MNNMISTLSRPEFIGTVPFSQNSVQTLGTNGGLLPSDRFYHSLLLEFRGRLTMPASTGPSAVQASAHAGIFERIKVSGYHKGRRQQELFIDVRGADLELLQRFMLPSNLVKTPSSIVVTGSAANDIILQLVVPFTPLRMPPALQGMYLLDAPNYDALKLEIQWGDFKSVVVPGATDATWSAYGSGSGTPQLRVIGQFAQSRNRFAQFVPGRIFRSTHEVTGSKLTTTANQVRLWDIPRGYDIRNILMKTGVKATDTTAGNNAYASYADFLTEIKVNRGLGRYIRYWNDGNAIYADVAQSYNLGGRITGVDLIEFASFGNPQELLDTAPLIAGPSGNVDLYLEADVAGASNRAATFLLEEWRFRPFMQRGPQ